VPFLTPLLTLVFITGSMPRALRAEKQKASIESLRLLIAQGGSAAYYHASLALRP
jgi:hypothetical protein